MNKIESVVYGIMDETNEEFNCLLKSIIEKLKKSDLSKDDKEVVAELIGYKTGMSLGYRIGVDLFFNE